MKAANFLNILLAIAVVLLSALLYAEKHSRAESAEIAETPVGEGISPSPTGVATNVTIDSTGLAPGVSGFGGPVPVTVELTNGGVASVSPKLPNDETPGFFKRLNEAGLWKAWDGLPVEVAATARVDAVASATYSSAAAIANVRAALAFAAGAEPPTNAPAAPAAERPHGPHGHHGGPHGGPHHRGPSASDAALAALGADASAITLVPPPAAEEEQP